MRNYVLHSSFDVRGILENWDATLLTRWAPQISKVAGRKLRTARELRRFLIAQLADGKHRLPVAERCDGYSDTRGCPGHDEESPA